MTRSAERPLGPSRTREDRAGEGAGWGLGEAGGGVAREGEAVEGEAVEGAGATEGATGALVVLVVAEEGWGCRLGWEGEEGGREGGVVGRCSRVCGSGVQVLGKGRHGGGLCSKGCEQQG